MGSSSAGDLIVARKDFPAGPEEFVTYVKANAGTLNMAHAGIGSNNAISVSCSTRAGTSLRLCPSAHQARQQRAPGRPVDYMCNAIPEVSGAGEARSIKAYAIGSPQRSRRCRTFPTAKEGGLPEFEAMPWWAFFAPGTPQPIRPAHRDLDQALVTRPCAGASPTSAATFGKGKSRPGSLPWWRDQLEPHPRAASVKLE